MKRFNVDPSDNVETQERKSCGGRPGIGPNGEPGVRVQVNLSEETLRLFDAWRGNLGRGPALRKLVESALRIDNR